MARTWTERRIAEPSTLKAEDVNLEHAAVARQINGVLDQHNVPLGSISNAKLVQGSPGGSARSTYLATSSYHRSVLPALGLDTAQIDVDPETDVVSGGWNSLADLLDDDGFVAEFTGRDGMIHGHALVDFERRTSYAKLDDGGVFTYPTSGDGNRLQFGVFLNGILIADSGPIPPKRFTVDLPFSHPCPAGPVRIETKYRAITIFQVDAGYVNDDGIVWSYPSTPPNSALRYPNIKFHAAGLYVRNQYR